VQQLHLVGFTTDLDQLILSSRKGAKSGSFLVPLDERLLEEIAEAVRRRNDGQTTGAAPPIEAPPEIAAAGRSSASGTGRARPTSALSPREIQARLRAGRSIADVAKEASADEEWITNFASPVIAERAQIIRAARQLVFSKPRRGPSAEALGSSVRWNLADRGVRLTDDEFDACWSAYLVGDALWGVTFEAVVRGRQQHAVWEVDLRDGEVFARNRVASDYGFVEVARRRQPPSLPAPSRSSGRSGDRSAPASKTAATATSRATKRAAKKAPARSTKATKASKTAARSGKAAGRAGSKAGGRSGAKTSGRGTAKASGRGTAKAKKQPSRRSSTRGAPPAVDRADDRALLVGGRGGVTTGADGRFDRPVQGVQSDRPVPNELAKHRLRLVQNERANDLAAGHRPRPSVRAATPAAVAPSVPSSVARPARASAEPPEAEQTAGDDGAVVATGSLDDEARRRREERRRARAAAREQAVPSARLPARRTPDDDDGASGKGRDDDRTDRDGRDGDREHEPRAERPRPSSSATTAQPALAPVVPREPDDEGRVVTIRASRAGGADGTQGDVIVRGGRPALRPARPAVQPKRRRFGRGR
jgi:hypothetical protein